MATGGGGYCVVFPPQLVIIQYIQTMLYSVLATKTKKAEMFPAIKILSIIVTLKFKEINSMDLFKLF